MTLTTVTTSIGIASRETVTVTVTSAPIQLTYRQKGHKFIEPTFLFTTSSPRQTKQLELTTTEVEEEKRDGHSVPSHFFQLEDYPEEKNFSIIGQSDDLSELFSEEADASVRESWMYNIVNNTSEEEVTELEGESETNTSIPSNETSNELERRPRDNTGGEHESLEGPYKRLQAQYGSW